MIHALFKNSKVVGKGPVADQAVVLHAHKAGQQDEDHGNRIKKQHPAGDWGKPDYGA